MTDIRHEIEKNKENIVKAIRKTGTAQIQTSKDGLKVVAIKKEVIGGNNG